MASRILGKTPGNGVVHQSTEAHNKLDGASVKGTRNVDEQVMLQFRCSTNSSEGKQRCPLNGMVPAIHVAVLKAVRNASTGFGGECYNSSSGSKRMMNGASVSALQIMVKQQGLAKATKTNEPWCYTKW